MNIFTSAVIAVLVILSLVLTAGVLFPDVGSRTIVWILVGGALVSIIAAVFYAIYRRLVPRAQALAIPRSERPTWRMPPLTLLAPPKLSTETRLGLLVLRTYLFIAMILVVIRIVQLALGR